MDSLDRKTSGRTATSALVGCAGWSIPKIHAACFDSDGSHLDRYASRFNCVEINTSFYKPHQTKTYARWAASTPDDFRFAVKAPKAITHECRLAETADLLVRFVDEVHGLGDKLGIILVQLPPSLRFQRSLVEDFFGRLGELSACAVACEPRHASWFSAEADIVLKRMRLSRVAADPSPVHAGLTPGGETSLVYFRLHGSPQMYYSPYSAEQLDELAGEIVAAEIAGTQSWCIFDNTAIGAAAQNGLDLIERLSLRKSAR